MDDPGRAGLGVSGVWSTWEDCHVFHRSRRRTLESVLATPEEVRAPAVGDDVVPLPDVVMDRGFDVAAPPEQVWPWIVQLGKWRAGWYLPRSVERLVPPSRRATRRVLPQWQGLSVGDVVPDYGGPRETFETALVDPPRHLVYRSRRGRTELSWAITLTAHGIGDAGAPAPPARSRTTRVAGRDHRRAVRRPHRGRDGRGTPGTPGRDATLILRPTAPRAVRRPRHRPPCRSACGWPP